MSDMGTCEANISNRIFLSEVDCERAGLTLIGVDSILTFGLLLRLFVVEDDINYQEDRSQRRE